MCGIVGVVHAGQANRDLAERMLTSIAHRGPDSRHIVPTDDGRVALGMATLGILPSSEPHGPLSSASGKWICAMNGEIYNYAELGQRLGIAVSPGVTDTRVVSEALARSGPSMVGDLVGMYAIAAVNQVTQRVYLIRDRLGEKPLYYRRTSDGIVFASGVRALHLSVPLRPLVPSSWLALETPLVGETMFEGVDMVPPGSIVTYDYRHDVLTVERYWDITMAAVDIRDAGYQEILLRFTELMWEAATRTRPRKDYALLLSGGLDSAVLAFLQRPSHTFTSTTMGADDLAEIERASRVATHVQAAHHVVRLDGKDLPVDWLDMIAAIEAPLGNSGAYPEFRCAQAIHEAGIRIVVGGIGPDELMVGYVRQVLLLAGAERLPASVRHLYLPLVTEYERRRTLAPSLGNLYFDLIRRGPEVDSSCRSACLAAFDAASDSCRATTLVELQSTFPSLIDTADRVTSWFGLERRSPYLYHPLVELMYGLPEELKLGGPGLSKRLLRDFADRLGVPNGVWANPIKMGFTAPVLRWMRDCHRDWFAERVRSALDYAEGRLLAEAESMDFRGAFSRLGIQLVSLACWNELVRRGLRP